MYAHRYEDIVNVGPGIQGKLEEGGIAKNDSRGRPTMTSAAQRRKPNSTSEKENSSSMNDRKRAEYSRLARFAGMGEIEFSKWLISATPMEREKVLREYKKRKEKISDGLSG